MSDPTAELSPLGLTSVRTREVRWVTHLEQPGMPHQVVCLSEAERDSLVAEVQRVRDLKALDTGYFTALNEERELFLAAVLTAGPHGLRVERDARAAAVDQSAFDIVVHKNPQTDAVTYFAARKRVTP